MTSPIDLLTRLKAQLDTLKRDSIATEQIVRDRSEGKRFGHNPSWVKAVALDWLLLSAAEIEEAIRQDHPPLSERPEPLKALYRQVDFGVPPSFTWLNERARELEAIFAASEQRVQALEAELVALRAQGRT